MLLLLFLLPCTISGPVPEFNLQTGGRGVQRDIPEFVGVDWTRSKRGVCYDKGSSRRVNMGQQFYLDCGRCTCDRYGFWCIPKCSPYQNPDLENCAEIVDIPDPCCPRQECVRYRDPSNGPTTDPWGKETMTQYNGVDDLKEKTTSLLTESVTITVTLDEGEETTMPVTSHERTTQFGGAFTTGSTQKFDSNPSSESGSRSSGTLTEIQTPTSPSFTTGGSESTSLGTVSTQRLTTPDLNTASSESSQAPEISTSERVSSSSEDRTVGYMTGTAEQTKGMGSGERRGRQDDNPSSGITYSIFSVTGDSDPSASSEGSDPSASTGSPGPLSTSPSQPASTSDGSQSASSKNPSVSPRVSRENPSPSQSTSSKNPSISTRATGENLPSSSSAPRQKASASTSASNENLTASGTASSEKSSVSQSSASQSPSGSRSTEVSEATTEKPDSESSLKTEVLSTGTMTMSTTEDSRIKSTPDYY